MCLGYFHVLAIVINAALNIGCTYLFKLVFSLFLDMYQGVELLDPMVVLFYFFWGNAILFSIVVALISFLPTMYEGFLFSVLSNICFCRLFDENHSDNFKVLTHCFDLHCLTISSIQHLFMCLLAICMSFLKWLFRSSPHFWLGYLGFFSALSFTSSLYIIDINPLSVTSLTNISSHSIACILVLLMIFLAVQSILSLIESHLVVFISFALGDRSKKILLQFMWKNLLLMFFLRSFMVSDLSMSLSL